MSSGIPIILHAALEGYAFSSGGGGHEVAHRAKMLEHGLRLRPGWGTLKLGQRHP